MIWLVGFLFVLPFGFVLLFGAPYLPTRKKTAELALDMLSLKPGQKLVDLGSGDGAVLIAAAKRKIFATGYELNPLVFAISFLRCLPHRKYVTIRMANFWRQDIANDTDGVFVFLLDRYMKKLDEKFSSELTRGTKVVSYTFKIPSKKIITEKQALYLYKY